MIWIQQITMNERVASIKIGMTALREIIEDLFVEPNDWITHLHSTIIISLFLTLLKSLGRENRTKQIKQKE